MKDIVVGMTGGDINGVGIEYALRMMKGGKSLALIQRVKGDKDGRVVSILDREDARELLLWLFELPWWTSQPARRSTFINERDWKRAKGKWISPCCTRHVDGTCYCDDQCDCHKPAECGMRLVIYGEDSGLCCVLPEGHEEPHTSYRISSVPKAKNQHFSPREDK